MTPLVVALFFHSCACGLYFQSLKKSATARSIRLFSFIHNVSFSIKIMCDNVLLAMFEASFSKKFRPYYLSISNIGTTSISFYLSSASSKMKWKEY
jgi:hypothetical protein